MLYPLASTNSLHSCSSEPSLGKKGHNDYSSNLNVCGQILPAVRKLVASLCHRDALSVVAREFFLPEHIRHHSMEHINCH